jgi:hypothetical protein
VPAIPPILLLTRYIIIPESSIRKMVSFASNVSHISMMEIARLSEKCEQLSEDINMMAVKIEEILSAHSNHTRYIGEGIQLSEYTYGYCNEK